MNTETLGTIEDKRMIAAFMNYAGGRPCTDELLSNQYNDWDSLFSVGDKIRSMGYWVQSLDGKTFITEIGEAGEEKGFVFIEGEETKKETYFLAIMGFLWSKLAPTLREILDIVPDAKEREKIIDLIFQGKVEEVQEHAFRKDYLPQKDTN